MTTKLTRYSPGAYGAMTEDEGGDYVRLSEIEPRIRRAVDNAKDSGIFAGSLIAEENAEELRAARDLLRWRKVGKEPAPGLCLVMASGFIRICRHDAGGWYWDGNALAGVTHWRPIGPMPEGGK